MAEGAEGCGTRSSGCAELGQFSVEHHEIAISADESDEAPEEGSGVKLEVKRQCSVVDSQRSFKHVLPLGTEDSSAPVAIVPGSLNPSLAFVYARHYEVAQPKKVAKCRTRIRRYFLQLFSSRRYFLPLHQCSASLSALGH